MMHFNAARRFDEFLRRWVCVRRHSIASMLTIGLVCCTMGCSSALPSKYLRQAEPGVTLTTLMADPEKYRGKVIVLGGVIVDAQQNGDELWLYMRNRPLDKDYRPHRPSELTGAEAGHYWVVIDPRKISPKYREWARATVVGQVTGMKATAAPNEPTDEPVLTAMYVRGWSGLGDNTHAWEEFEDPNYRLRVPRGIHGEFGPQ